LEDLVAGPPPPYINFTWLTWLAGARYCWDSSSSSGDQSFKKWQRTVNDDDGVNRCQI
jgi:hypothetical protein